MHPLSTIAERAIAEIINSADVETDAKFGYKIGRKGGFIPCCDFECIGRNETRESELTAEPDSCVSKARNDKILLTYKALRRHENRHKRI